MKVYFLKLRANIELDGDLKLAVREINALFDKNIPVHRNGLTEAQNYIELSEEVYNSHTREGEIIGYLGINPKVELPELLKQLSFIQEVWILNEEFINKNAEFFTKTGNFVCAVPFLALSEFLTYSKTEIPTLQLVKTILDVLSLKLEDKKISKLIARRNTSTAHVHGLHTYKAKFFPRFVRSLIVSETPLENRENKTILDPFVGSGTAVVEAALLGFRGIGIDIDKLSCLISESKINLLENSFASVQKNALQICGNTNGQNGHYKFPSWISRKFERNEMLKEQQSYEKEINNWSAKISCADDNKELFQTALSDALTRKFNIRMMGTGVGRFALEIRKTEISTIVEKNLKYTFKCAKIIEILRKIYRIEKIRTEIINDTAIKLPLEDETVDFIITSPPYLPASSGRENYLIGKSISLTALGLMNEESIKETETKSVGSMKNQIGAGDGLPNAVYELYQWLDNDELRNIKAQPTLIYYQELKKSLGESYRVLKKDGKAVFIIGKETVFYSYKTREILFRVECDEIFKAIALSVGFEIEETIDIELDKKNRNPRPRSLDKYFESAIILKKT